jgi:hypothetical protein
MGGRNPHIDCHSLCHFPAVKLPRGLPLPNSLIDELQLDASNPAVPVTSLLRKALIVANKLDLSDIPEWISQELSGYENQDTIPNYRIVHGQVKVKNPVRGWIPVQFPTNELQHMVSEKNITESVAQIEALCKRKGTLIHSFPPEAQQALQQMFQEDMEFTCFLEKSRFEGILDEIRNQVIRWAIALDRAGVRGDGLSFTGAEKDKAHSLIVHADGGTFNFGVVGNVSGQASVATGFQPRAGSISVEDVTALIAEITKNMGGLNLPVADAEELNAALAELDKTKPDEPGKLRQLLSRVLGIVGRAGETIITVGTRAYVEAWMRQHGLGP